MQMIERCKVCQTDGALEIKRYKVNSSFYPDLKVVFGERKDISVGLRLCSGCGFIYHDHILSLDELEKVYLQEDRISHKKDNIQKKVLLARAVSFLNKTFDFKKITKTIDVGSGDFSLLESLSSNFPMARFDAVNVSYEHDYYGKIKVFHAMLEDMNEQADKYQVVILSHILEHIADFDLFFSGLKNITSSETQLYVEVPFQVGPGIFLSRGFHAQHINYFTPLTLEFLLARFGYKLDKIEFDTEGGYYYYGIPGIIRAKFSREVDNQKKIKGIRSLMSSLFFLIDPTIFITGRLKNLLFQKKI